MGDLLSSSKRINGKIWSTSNLDVSTFRNGDPIHEAKTGEEWVEAGDNKQPAWCWTSNDPKERKKYGKLYNHYAVADPRGLAPQGWRIPSEDELESLIVDGQLTDEINLPMAGFRDSAGGFLHFVGSGGHYWSSSVDGSNARFLRFRIFISRDADVSSGFRARGLSVCCLKD